MAEVNKGNDDLLENFRRQWESEISAAKNQQSTNSSNQLKSKTFSENKETEDFSKNKQDIADDEEMATSMQLYLQGVRHEESGEVVEAIKYYKRAMQLVPDIEQRMYMYPKNKEKEHSTLIPHQKSTPPDPLMEKSSQSYDYNNLDDMDDTEDEFPVDILEKFQRVALHDGRICIPQEEPKGTHISALPREIVVYLLKWVVSSDLDLRSLEQVSLVCRGLYLCSRDTELWKLACFRVWNTECTPKSCGFASYRDMFISQPRLQFNGCYISKTSYVRPGENSFQDSNYQPWHMVNYFRYLRFFPDRTAVMSTTADIPNLVVGKRLKKKDPSCVPGHYTLRGNLVTCIFKRKRVPEARLEHSNRSRRRNDEINNNGSKIIEQVFHLELEIKSTKQKLHCALHWKGYMIETIYQDKEPSTAHFDVNPARFPPLWFSRVRSYNAQSEQPL